MLYECTRIKLIWCNISTCMQLNISLKHVILGILCDNFVSDNKNICVAIVSFTIYSYWCKASINHGDYAALEIKKNITQKLSFYGEVYSKLLLGKLLTHFKRLIECIIFHLQDLLCETLIVFSNKVILDIYFYTDTIILQKS